VLRDHPGIRVTQLDFDSATRAVFERARVGGVFTRRRLLSLATLPAAIALAPVAVRASPRPIAEESFVPIGGIEQWVAIRGRKRSRLPILFLHGGPCEAQSPLLSLFAPWEERYVVALDSDVSRLIG
jgi:hypothetical protein